MSKKRNNTFKMTVLAAALLGVYGPALAGEEGTSTNIVLERNSVSVGAGYWTNDRPQEGQFDGMYKSGTYGLFDADILKRYDATGTWIGLKARNLGLDDREISVDWARQGKYGVSFEYSRIPHNYPLTYSTGLLNSGPVQVERAITPGTIPGVQGNTRRDRYTTKFFMNLMPGLNFNADVRYETKEGTRPWGYFAGFGEGTGPEFLADPIDSNTKQLTATLDYSRNNLQLSGGYYGTQYDATNTLVSITSINTSTYYISEPIDNQSNQVFLNGGYNFTPTTRGTFKISYQEAKADDTLPTAAIPGLASPMAPKSLDGKVETTVVEMGLTARPMPKLHVVANLRYRDYADKTPLQRVVFPAPPAPGGDDWSTPLSYTTKSGKLEGTYLLPQSVSLLGGIEYKYQNRTIQASPDLLVPQTPNLEEWTYRVQLRKSMSETVTGAIRYEYSDRQADSYTPAYEPLPVGILPAENYISPVNIADRKRNRLRGIVDWMPMDRLTLQLAAEFDHDSYNGPNALGLQSTNTQLYSVDAAYQINPQWQVKGWYSYVHNKADELTLQDDAPFLLKSNNLTENDSSFGAGVQGQVSSKLKVGANIEQFRTNNGYAQALSGSYASGSTGPLPNVTTTLLKFGAYAQYAVQKNADVRLVAFQERWSSNDWIWQHPPALNGFVPWPYFDGTTVTSQPNQNSVFVGARYIYKFH